MQQATATAERVVAVLSAAYLASATGKPNGGSSTPRTPAASEGCCCRSGWTRSSHRGLLKTRMYVDLVDKDAASARAALLAAARGARGKPTEEPEFPGDRGQRQCDRGASVPGGAAADLERALSSQPLLHRP